MYHDVEAV
jgi:hypothetical protein